MVVNTNIGTQRNRAGADGKMRLLNQTPNCYLLYPKCWYRLESIFICFLIANISALVFYKYELLNKLSDG
jgi:hypothetical protein